MPLYHKKLLKEGSILTIWEVQETEEELRSALCISNKENEELCMIRSFKNRLQWLASRLALQSIFDDKESTETKKDTNGKPYLTRCAGHISLTHSGNMAAAIFNPQRSVGIDIELMRSKIFDVDKKFLSLYELQFLAKEKNKMEALFVCWCAKESVYKWYGRKGLSLKDSIAIRPFTYQREGIIEATINVPGNPVMSIHYESIGEYMLAYLCT